MLNLLVVLGAAFLMKGILFCFGRTVPKNVVEKLGARGHLRGWCIGTGTVQILWGVSCLLLWLANKWVPYALYLLAATALCVVISIILSLRTAQKYKN